MRPAVMKPQTKPPTPEIIYFIELHKSYSMPDEVVRLGGLAPQEGGNTNWWPASGSELLRIPQKTRPTYYRLVLAGTNHEVHWIQASKESGCLCFELLAEDKVPRHIRDRAAN